MTPASINNCLVNSVDLITALSNDIGYEEIFSEQLENYSEKSDVLIIISCSGASKNIINAQYIVVALPPSIS